MLIIKIILIALLGSVCSILIKPIKFEFSVIIIICTGILILFQVMDYFVQIINFLTDLTLITGVEPEIFSIILKIVGIGYLIEFSSALCNDAGLSAISTKLEFAGKVIILFISLPIIQMLIDIISELLSV
jgi:stage III sporulation protein AD